MNIKTTILALAVIFTVPGMAFATTSCPKQGGGYMCPGNVYIDGSKASSAAEAYAVALAKQSQTQGQGQDQSQGQGQTQTSDNSNSSSNTNTNGGNSVVVEGAPKVTASFGVGVSVSVPVGQNYVQKRHESAADWYMKHGDSCTAFAIMDRSPVMRKLKISRNCGDKG